MTPTSEFARPVGRDQLVRLAVAVVQLAADLQLLGCFPHLAQARPAGPWRDDPWSLRVPGGSLLDTQERVMPSVYAEHGAPGRPVPDVEACRDLFLIRKGCVTLIRESGALTSVSEPSVSARLRVTVTKADRTGRPVW